jgi:hypothetical protein
MLMLRRRLADRYPLCDSLRQYLVSKLLAQRIHDFVAVFCGPPDARDYHSHEF